MVRRAVPDTLPTAIPARQADVFEAVVLPGGADSCATQYSSTSLSNVASEIQDVSHSKECNRQISSEKAWEIQTLEIYRKIFDAVGHGDSPGHSDVEIGMKNMYRQITNGISTLKQAGDRRKIQYLQVRADEAFLELSPILFPSRQVADLTNNLNTVLGAHTVQLRDILASFTAVALTWWPQKIFQEHREQWAISSQGRFETFIRKYTFCFSPGFDQ